MKTHEFDHVLTELGKRPLPDLPGSFRQDVWREIHQRQQEPVVSWRGQIDQWLALFLQPQPILASLILAVMVGASGAAWVQPSQGLSKSGLDMALFGPSPTVVNLGVWK
jgi:hypothetical protein